MTTTPERPRLLPLIPTGHRHGSRSHVTCFYRCGNACDQPIPNTTETGHIADEIRRVVGRRSVLAGGAAGAAAMVLGGLADAAVAAPSMSETPVPEGFSRLDRVQSLATTPFGSVKPNVRDQVTVPDAFSSKLVIAWGDRVTKDAPHFGPMKQSPEAARKQFGYNADYVGVLPHPKRADKAILVVNHEYTNEELMFPAGRYSDNEIRKIAMANHGMSVVEIKKGKRPGAWEKVPPGYTTYNRRIHSETKFALVGPAAGDRRLRTSADPSGRIVKGTLNNCAGGLTPWGTVLSGEENFNQYFELPEGASLDSRYAAEYERYGISGAAGRGWHKAAKRFNLAAEPHEPHRFGWVVEVDPLEPNSRPVKHTMLGRFKHEGANVIINKSGHAVAYMGDDERGDYIYKFVSAEKFDDRGTPAARRHNKTLLTKGTLYVAKFTGDGTGDGEYDGRGWWIKMCTDTKSFVPGMSVADVLIFTRLAADKLRPTRMDRPEDVEPNPVNGRVYAALTNNSARGSTFAPDEANPITSSMTRPELGAPLVETSGNRNGYVLEIIPKDDSHTKQAFTWNLMLVCGDPAAQETYFAGYDKSKVSPISCPDNLAFDVAGNMWVSTDGNVLGSNDGVFRVPTEGPHRGWLKQFATVPRGAECCGPFLYGPRSESLFIAVQHPGEGDGSTIANPASTWPHTHSFPRPGVAVIFKTEFAQP